MLILITGTSQGIGKAIAEKLYKRHTMLTEFLRAIGVSSEIASEDACKIEHVISEETFQALKRSHDKFIHLP